MCMRKKILISTSYLGPVTYFAELATADEIIMEAYETYPKQTYRNRCRIITANGLLNLTIPVVKVHGNHTKIKDVKISFDTKWQQLHWRAITSAYRHSPFFMFYEDALAPFYQNKFDTLLQFNLELTNTVLKLAGFQKEIKFSNDFVKETPSEVTDLRNAFSPKTPVVEKLPAYIQVFEERHGFQHDLSIMDLLLNLGPETKTYLQKIAVL